MKQRRFEGAEVSRRTLKELLIVDLSIGRISLFGKDIALRCPRPRLAGGTMWRGRFMSAPRCAAMRRGRRSAPSLPGGKVRCALVHSQSFLKIFETKI